MWQGYENDGNGDDWRSGWSLRPDAARTGPAADLHGTTLLRPTLGTVQSIAGVEVTVELYTNTGGAGFVITAPAVHHAAFQPGDTVLVLFHADDPDAAVVVGRIGNLGDRLTAATVLALLLGVDGAGSALDADTLDGRHEAALLRADGSRPLSADWDTGAGRSLVTDSVRARTSDGLRLATSADTLGAFVDGSGRVGIGTATPGDALDVAGSLRSSGAQLAGYGGSTADAILAAGRARTASGFAYLDLVGDPTYSTYGTRLMRDNAGANARSHLIHRGTGDLQIRTSENAPILLMTQGSERARVRNAGLGISGPGAAFEPQGALHTHDGTGGWMLTSKTAIGATAQLLVADGAGDVTAIVRVEALVSNGTARTFASATLEIGGVTTQNVTVGAETFQFRLNAAGSLDVRRTAGTLAGTVVVRLMWL